ncbi:S-type anion channel SLAH3 [Apostasia shenzhenica]|uniref:S-type anion channel SLAH3 n=1 Tax=Apostasia shenzhenica TaxID=1088818 RepID=A0A2I0AU35_9ASPA|nr:S-type anion channel SLAH3 [Apostasia shenzhenica]
MPGVACRIHELIDGVDGGGVCQKKAASPPLMSIISLMENQHGLKLPPDLSYIKSEDFASLHNSSGIQEDTLVVEGTEAMENHDPSTKHPVLSTESHKTSHSVSIYLPASSSLDMEQSRTEINDEESETKVGNRQKLLRNEKLHKQYNSFKTMYGILEKQLSSLQWRQKEPVENNESQNREMEPLPAMGRYFDALEGPELETLRASEGCLLPQDKKWPFLLRFPISAFAMCLGVSSQAVLWKTLATSPSMSFLTINTKINLVLWCISIALMCFVASIYTLKLLLFFKAVKREYCHPVRINFFFAPWIACLFLVIGLPPQLSKSLHATLWYVLMAPILCLELKIYGQWMSGGECRLSKVANPSNHLSIVGNFVGALLGASMGLKEGPVFFFAVGLAHYVVLFVTLYQRLPTNETLPKELHPVFFLFIAAPSIACMAWAKITGSFDLGSRIAYFIALFLYASLVVRINFFRGFRFSLAWWAYTFPTTSAAIATIHYSVEVNNHLTKAIAVALSTISTFTILVLLIATILHAFVFCDLFPNDIAIAITEKKPKSRKNLRKPSSEDDVEAFLYPENSTH